ncbi:hypothetical protein CLG85_012255 [Yangia mangrovi]|uniref:Uncharacterized protein n=1 Tax=Alloyangia mangrovi TaxID=1779329 RepID=A0A2A3JWC3_9RHOB|nr:hypothetical protein [Alloyangia mangrovi]MCA0942150.1 hypothetical protein [Alloyangia pacifica]MCA0947179.1 hypothetical protein [Alloyangia pacifica]MCT4371047.1 hypothetical protein [Alloyangia mangrovi]
MNFLNILLLAYLVTVLVALTLTHRERRRHGHRSALYAVLGYALCLVWPLVAAVMVLFYRQPASRT